MNSWTNIISAMINSLISGFSLLTLMIKPLHRFINKLIIVIEFNTNPIIADPIPINVTEMNKFILKLKSDIILDISWSNAISQKRCVLFQILNCFIKFLNFRLFLSTCRVAIFPPSKLCSWEISFRCQVFIDHS